MRKGRADRESAALSVPTDSRISGERSMQVETVKIKDAQAPGGHVIINKSDFDADKHELFEPVEQKEPKAPKQPAKKDEK